MMGEVDNYFFNTEGAEGDAEGAEALCVLLSNSVFSVSTLCLCVLREDYNSVQSTESE